MPPESQQSQTPVSSNPVPQSSPYDMPHTASSTGLLSGKFVVLTVVAILVVIGIGSYFGLNKNFQKASDSSKENLVASNTIAENYPLLNATCESFLTLDQNTEITGLQPAKFIIEENHYQRNTLDCIYPTYKGVHLNVMSNWTSDIKKSVCGFYEEDRCLEFPNGIYVALVTNFKGKAANAHAGMGNGIYAYYCDYASGVFLGNLTQEQIDADEPRKEAVAGAVKCLEIVRQNIGLE